MAALPVSIDENGAIRVMLVTSRETRRYVIPKGWPWPGLKGHKAAAMEAREEAGIVGQIRKKSIGAYSYIKRRPDGELPVRVRVFVLAVNELLEKWPEQKERSRQWFTVDEAAAAVNEPELAEIIREFAKQQANRQGQLH